MKDETKNANASETAEKGDDRSSVFFLRKLALTQDRHKRLKIIKAYARLNTRLAEKVLIEALSDPCEEIRDFLIKELGGRRQLDMALAFPKLMIPPWYAKSAILKIISLRKPDDAIQHIARVLDDSNADVRKCAAEALGEIGGRDSLRLLVRLKKDRNPYVRQAAEQALRKASQLRFS